MPPAGPSLTRQRSIPFQRSEAPGFGDAEEVPADFGAPPQLRGAADAEIATPGPEALVKDVAVAATGKASAKAKVKGKSKGKGRSKKGKAGGHGPGWGKGKQKK